MLNENEQYLSQLRQLRKTFGFEFCGIAVALKGSKTLLTWVYATGNKNHYFRNIVLEAGKGIAGRTYKTGNILVIQDVDKELTNKEKIDYPITIVEGLRSLMAIPLWKKGQCEGVLLLAMREANCITPELFEDVMMKIAPVFCDFEVRYEQIRDTIGVKYVTNFEPVPIYELMSYPVLQAREDERKRIARDLHDSVVQNVLGVQLLVRAASRKKDSEAIAPLLVQADEWLTKIQDELRTIATSLRPASLDDLGLVASLNSYFKRIEDTYPVKIHFRQNVGNKRYSPNMETTFYRICQEATRNACKYAQTEDIDISLLDSVNYLVLQVKDSGSGFNVEKPEIKGGGMGISDMKEWAEFVDGELNIQSTPGKGTKIWISAPILKKEV